MEHAKGLGSAYLSPNERAKAGRVSAAMLRHTFARLRRIIEWPDDDEPLAMASL